MLLLPLATANGTKLPINQPRPVARFATGVDGSIPIGPTSFEPPQGQGWSPLGPTSGTVRLAVIAVQFSDIPHVRTINQLRQDYFGGNNSLATYYSEVSYGKLSVTGDVFGWYTLPYAEAHYGKNCLNINDANCDGQDVSWEVAQDIVKQAEKDINFSNYDYFAFVHSGNGQESSKVPIDVWSVTYVSGVEIQTSTRALIAFNIVAEREANGRVPLGVYCAEFGHLLGVPDMFNTATGRTEMGPWELEEMGTWNGHPSGSSPAEMSSWDRLKIGWLSQSDEEILTESTQAVDSLNPLEECEGLRAAEIVTSNSYYLLEVRAPIGFDSALPSFGVIAYQITNSDVVAPFRKVAGLMTAFDAGYQYVSNGSIGPNVSFKVFSSFVNGSYLIGFGSRSFIQGITLTIKLDPATANVTVEVNGQAYLTDGNGTLGVINVGGSDWFNVTVPSVSSLGVGSRVVFERWSNGANSTTIRLPEGSGEVTALYNVQYYVGVNTSHGTPSGTGWYDRGANAIVALPQTVNDTQPGIRYIFTAWQGVINETSNSLTLQVETPANLTAVWGTQYYVDVDTGGHAVALGTGWYDAGSNAAYSVLPPNAANGSWYIFERWSGDCTNSDMTGNVYVTKPMRLTAEWVVLDWMTITFVDASGERVTASRELVTDLLAPNGTTIQLDQNLAPGMWLQNGTYLVTEVTTLGSTVSYDGESFTTAPNGEATIPLALYDLTFKVHDLITSLPISGVAVTVSLPDGSTESNATGTDGTAVFQQLPLSSYLYEVNGDWLLQSAGNATLSPDGSTSLSVGVIYFPSLAALVVSSLVIVIVLTRVVKRRKGTGDRRRSDLEDSSSDEDAYNDFLSYDL
jgi:M6 family metalloprotease-like protein